MTGGCLFNIEDDEIESKNLKDSKPEIYADLKGLLTSAKLVENGYVPHQLYIANPDCVGATIERDIWIPWDMILEEEEEIAPREKPLGSIVVVGVPEQNSWGGF